MKYNDYRDNYNIKNLTLLRDFMIENKETIEKQDAFDMGFYIRCKDKGLAISPNRLDLYNKCGTIKCLMGWAITLFYDDLKEKELSIYRATDYLFGVGERYHSAWSFLFCQFWVDYDNTIEGAINRLNIFINGKYYKGWDYEDYKKETG